MNKNIYCVRHGQAIHNINFLKHGVSTFYDPNYVDTRLTEKGISQSIQLGKDWNDINDIDLVITSPQYRTLETTYNIFNQKLNKIHFPFHLR